MTRNTFSPATIIGLFNIAFAIILLAIAVQISFDQIWTYDYESDEYIYQGFDWNSEGDLIFLCFSVAGAALLISSAGIFFRQLWSVILLQIIWALFSVVICLVLIPNITRRAAPVTTGLLLALAVLGYTFIRWCNAPWVKPLFRQETHNSKLLDQDFFE